MEIKIDDWGVTYDASYGMIDFGDSPKCAWCGKTAKNLPMSHFKKHEEEDLMILLIFNHCVEVVIVKNTQKK